MIAGFLFLIKALGIDWLGVSRCAQRKLRAIGGRVYGMLLCVSQYSLNPYARANALLPLLQFGISIFGALENGPFPVLIRALKDRHPFVREKAAEGIAAFISNDFMMRTKEASRVVEEALDIYIECREDVDSDMLVHIIGLMGKLTIDGAVNSLMRRIAQTAGRRKVRVAAINTLGRFRDFRSLEILTPLLEVNEETYRPCSSPLDENEKWRLKRRLSLLIKKICGILFWKKRIGRLGEKMRLKNS